MYEIIEHWKKYQKEKRIEKLEKELKFLLKEEKYKQLDKFMWKLYHKNGTINY